MESGVEDADYDEEEEAEDVDYNTLLVGCLQELKCGDCTCETCSARRNYFDYLVEMFCPSGMEPEEPQREEVVCILLEAFRHGSKKGKMSTGEL